ncbi:MAG: SDR family NAD(P)-dependent oxidoreductase [bacterium]
MPQQAQFEGKIVLGARACSGPGRVIAGEAADLTDPEGVTRSMERLFEQFGGLDLLVNNAGVSRMDTGEGKGRGGAA